MVTDRRNKWKQFIAETEEIRKRTIGIRRNAYRNKYFKLSPKNFTSF